MSGFDDYKRHSRANVERAVEVVRDRTIKEARRVVPSGTGETRETIVAGRTFWIGDRCVSSVEAGGRALFIEFGTSKQAARPFLGPSAIEALRSLSPQDLKDYRSELTK